MFFLRHSVVWSRTGVYYACVDVELIIFITSDIFQVHAFSSHAVSVQHFPVTHFQRLRPPPPMSLPINFNFKMSKFSKCDLVGYSNSETGER